MATMGVGMGYAIAGMFNVYLQLFIIIIILFYRSHYFYYFYFYFLSKIILPKQTCRCDCRRFCIWIQVNYIYSNPFELILNFLFSL